ncbi:hypothetical protein EDB83DRAFT_2320161 [Lactarius deliciosus]|nr:hypothetical protein EDB83DRAFT_2320161 [Lactarius deliciosus]
MTQSTKSRHLTMGHGLTTSDHGHDNTGQRGSEHGHGFAPPHMPHVPLRSASATVIVVGAQLGRCANRARHRNYRNGACNRVGGVPHIFLANTPPPLPPIIVVTPSSGGRSCGWLWVNVVRQQICQWVVSGAHKGQVQENALTTCSNVAVLGPVNEGRRQLGWGEAAAWQRHNNAVEAGGTTNNKKRRDVGVANRKEQDAHVACANTMSLQVVSTKHTPVGTTTRDYGHHRWGSNASQPSSMCHNNDAAAAAGVGKEDVRYSTNTATSPVAAASCSNHTAPWPCPDDNDDDNGEGL